MTAKRAERSWEWIADCCTYSDSGCRSSKTISLDPNGLAYTGFCADVSYGGGYTTGFQTVAEFLDDGPLDEQLPAALAEEIHAYLAEHQQPTGWVELAAVVADSGRVLERVDAHLDDVGITAGRPLTRGNEAVFFAGSIEPGDHVVSAAFVFLTHRATPDIAYSTDEAFTVTAGEHLRIVFTVTDRTATAVTTRPTTT